MRINRDLCQFALCVALFGSVPAAHGAGDPYQDQGYRLSVAKAIVSGRSQSPGEAIKATLEAKYLVEARNALLSGTSRSVARHPTPCNIELAKRARKYLDVGNDPYVFVSWISEYFPESFGPDCDSWIEK